jgi:hypothetical protein
MRALSGEVDPVVVAQVEDMLARRLYKVDFTRAYPMSAPSFYLNYPYYISVIGDRVESFLPYFGRAYNIPYGGGEGLRFAAPISDYTETLKRNGRREIHFTATTDEDSYRFSLAVFPGGQSDLSVSASRRQSISFSGQVDLDPEFEAVRVAE